MVGKIEGIHDCASFMTIQEPFFLAPLLTIYPLARNSVSILWIERVDSANSFVISAIVIYGCLSNAERTFWLILVEFFFYLAILLAKRCDFLIKGNHDIDEMLFNMEYILAILIHNGWNAISSVCGQFHVQENSHQHVISRSADALEEQFPGLSCGKATV